MPQRLTLEDMQELAASRGGKCLASEYRSARVPLRWQCAERHDWDALPDNVRNKGSWCPVCAGLKPHTIDEMRRFAVGRGGVCISPSYRGLYGKIHWKCAKGHGWEASPKSILHQGTWCPECAGNTRRSLPEMQQIAGNRGGTCTSAVYVNDGTKLTWRCASAHDFEATPSNVKRGRWCPDCSTGLGERLARAAFEQLFRCQFNRCRPEFLRDIRGVPLELDGWCESLKLAFEHQGDAHFKFTPKFHRTMARFHDQQRRDRAKRKACEARGITLIEIPEVPSRLSIESLASFIVEAVRGRRPDIEVKLAPGMVDYRGVYATDAATAELAMLMQRAKERGGSIISRHYLRRDLPLEWECAAGHRWRAKPANILQGQWCARCARCAKLSIEDLHNAADAHRGECLATEYTNNQTKVPWRCGAGHTFSAALATVRKGHWCPHCR